MIGQPLWNRPDMQINTERPPQIDARVRHLAQCHTAAVISADPLAIDEVFRIAAEELLRCEVPERRSSERNEHGARRRLQSSFEFVILRVGSPLRDHYKNSTRIIGLQCLGDSDNTG